MSVIPPQSKSLPALRLGRRIFLRRMLGLAVGAGAVLSRSAFAQERRYSVAFANLSELPGDTLEDTGFTGADVRDGFRWAARQMPVELLFFDNARDSAKALAHVDEAIRRRVDVYIQYHADPAGNAETARRLKAAGIPAVAIHYPVPGAPLYTPDNAAAGRIAGEALAAFAQKAWAGQPLAAAVIGKLTGASADLRQRVAGVDAGLHATLPGLALEALDTRGNPFAAQGLLEPWLAGLPGRKFLLATLDDSTALVAKDAVERVGRRADCVIVSHGCDGSVHGGYSDKKEIHPANSASILLGSVAFYLDRYGYDVLPLALRAARGEPVPARTVTAHKLITPANVFREYPPADMQ